MKAIIFGINGQDGFYLNELLIKNNYEVTGVSRSAGTWVPGDVKDFDFVSSLVKTIRPDIIFHLAANSTTRHEALFSFSSCLKFTKNRSLDTHIVPHCFQYYRKPLARTHRTPYTALGSVARRKPYIHSWY